MSDGYSGHSDYMSWVSEDAKKRQTEVDKAFRKAFASFIENRKVEVIVFSNVSVIDLADAIIKYPLILKSLIAVCNIAGRTIERDLQIKNVDTYSPKLSEKKAAAIAGYIKPFLPPYLEIPVLSNLDRVSFIDKEIRKAKGRWELGILDSLNKFGSARFKKRKFSIGHESFEIDAASPEEGTIRIAVDVKRIEARKDIHKRSDEIVNKAGKVKEAYPDSKFVAVIYYPFIDEHGNIRSRLQSGKIDAIFFAAESKDSVENAIKMLLAKLGAAK